MNKEEFIKELEKLNIQLTEEKLKKLDDFYKLLIEKNKVMNLTAITEKNEVYLKHFYDSITVCKIINLNQKISICDLGTGAGFPGIVLKIIFSNLELTLVDSLEKRCKFLQEVKKELNLDFNIICSRIEEFSINNKEQYDVLISRAVAKTSIILELGIQALKIDGFYILMKSNVDEELKNIDNCLKKLDLTLLKKEEFELPKENSKRTLLMFQKNKSTNDNYPREYSKIKKKNL